MNRNEWQKWEQIGEYVCRFRIPKGWIIEATNGDQTAATMFYLEDEGHQWSLFD